MFSRFNALDQALDIAGSVSAVDTLTLSDEASGYGKPTANSGSTANITVVSAGVATIADITGMAADSVGKFITISGATPVGNNGTFLIVEYVSATSVKYSNTSAVVDTSGAISWAERGAYTLEDDLNYARTDRAAIKGVGFAAAVPTYQRPTAIGTPVTASLSNIAGKTLDAKGFVMNRKFNNVSVAATNTFITLSSVGNLKHSSATDKTGVPTFDAGPYSGNREACYVEILDNSGSNVLTTTGLKVIGFTRAGAATSPNSVEVVFYKLALGDDLANAVTYTWEAGIPTTVDMFYGYFQRLDLIDESAFRTTQTLGLEENGALRQDITDLQSVVGMTDGDTFLTGLTNTGNFFPFVGLDATPSVTEALNVLNAQIGDRNYTGAYLTDGETLTASLQALSDAVSGASMVRYTERLASDLAAHTAHTLPGGATYTLDGTNNARNLSVFSRGLLRDAGTVANGDDYQETSTTSVTFYFKHKAGDHINYLVYA